jgi:2,3-bisphosphoglycerate-independent phosphoglycerate mutase
VHAFLDGRDTPPNSATTYVKDALDAIKDAPNIQLSTLCGRYFAMDRDKRWDRVEKAYNLLVDAKGERADDALSQLETAYSADISDEFMHASTLNGYAGMHDGDGLLMANFRADRAREILTALLDDAFDGFARTRAPRFAATLGMIEYSDALNPFMPAMFPPESVSNGIGEVTSAAGLKQLRIAETEKYAHVTFFMNGGREAPFVGEERILIPSPDVATYDLQPEMSAPEMTEKLCASITSGEYGLIIANYANPDMVGHSGKFDAAVKAVEAIDTCLGLLKAAVLQAGGAMLITADHGNVEQMIDPASGGAHTAHTLNPVPLVLMQENAETWQLADGTLADLAPSLLALLGLTQPQEMSGRNLIDEAH